MLEQVARECITDSWRFELFSFFPFAMVITQSNGKSIMWYVAHVPPSLNTFSLSLRFWHWTSPHTFYAAVCVYVHLLFLSFFKGESIDFPFHFIRYLFYLYVYHYFVVARCVVARGFNALWLFSFNWNSRHFNACFGKNWQIYLSSNFFGLISSHWEDF